MDADDELTLTFKVREWRWIAAACAAVKAASLIEGRVLKPRLREIAHRIAKETGKNA